jgi:hypothetical protein
MVKAPLTLPVFVAAMANLKLPKVVVGIVREDPASMRKSSAGFPSPAIVMVVVPLVDLVMLIAALLTNFNWAQLILPEELAVTGPVTGVAPPRFVPSKIRMSAAFVLDVRADPLPFNDVFQLVSVLIGPLLPTQ